MRGRGIYPQLMQSWFDAMESIGIDRGVSFDLDFHTIPFHGEDALVEKHYVSKRSRKQKGILTLQYLLQITEAIGKEGVAKTEEVYSIPSADILNNIGYILQLFRLVTPL